MKKVIGHLLGCIGIAILSHLFGEIASQDWLTFYIGFVFIWTGIYFWVCNIK